MKTPQIVIAAFISAAALVSGCTTTTSTPMSSSSSSSYYPTAVYGVIDAIEVTRTTSSDGIGGSGIGAGTVIGGVVGGVLGSQVGSGTGQDIATVAGVVGGAMVGHEIEKNRQQQQQDVYRVRVRLDSGGYQIVTQQSIADLRVGDRVRIENDRVTRY